MINSIKDEKRYLDSLMREKDLKKALESVYKDSIKKIEIYSVIQTIVKTLCFSFIVGLFTLKFSFPEIYVLSGKTLCIYTSIFVLLSYYIDNKMYSWILRDKLRICVISNYYKRHFKKNLIEPVLIDGLRQELAEALEMDFLNDFIGI